MPKTPRKTPAELAKPWPTAPSPDIAGERARLLALNLQAAIDARRRVKSGVSVRSIADTADLDEGTIRNILTGARWPDLRTITRLEEALDTSLWPVRRSRDDVR
ncbi:helix-turn-helix transcriptional regulator [Microbacterium sp. C5A9]|jgi:hypothetical protein|uniref:helix-turn-helix domain-containing protein n=1 Tax=Microbacterium sp. C5A9 TaxID=2736663 RepID=UPI0035ABEC3E|nr:helix-turn-helix transcriptional regulator [Microbacterium sp. C5A9]